jgi:hypothetical protein
LLLPVGLVVGLCGVGGTLLAASALTDYAGPTDFYYSAPHLPDFAHPAGAKFIDEWEGDCGGSAVSLPCRTLFFHTSEPFDEAQRRLLVEFRARGWSVRASRGSGDTPPYILSASLDAEDLCIMYTSDELGPLASPKAGYTEYISVDIWNCSKSGGG